MNVVDGQILGGNVVGLSNKDMLRVGGKTLGYKLFRATGAVKMLPLSLTVSVTNVCNSKCKTCYIWSLYQEKPFLKKDELTTYEFGKIFESVGRSLIWLTISGGEPFTRPDLAEICEAAYDHCHPKILIIPTNCLLPDVVLGKAKKILGIYRDSQVILNLSFDGVGKAHDLIRGVPGNFDKVIETLGRLKELKKEFPNFEVGLHSVASQFNIRDLLSLYDYAKQQNPDNYICEIAEHRSELFNIDKSIEPEFAEYKRFIEELRRRAKNDYPGKGRAARLIRAFRLKYYEHVIEELEKKRAVIPCYAGITSAQISAYGDVWPCCIMAYGASMGNLRGVGYDFRKIWFSKRAEEVRKRIKSSKCYCPMANVHYTNALCNYTTVLQVLWNSLG